MASIKNKGTIIKSKGTRISEFCVNFFLVLMIFVTLYPVWHVLMYSLSDSKAAMTGGLFLYPRKLSFVSYEMLFKTKTIFMAYKNTILKTVVGTAVAMVVTTLTSYSLSQEVLKGRRVILLIMYFTMLFSGGTIPTYLVVRDMHLLDSFWAYVIPGAMSVYNMFVLKNAFERLPRSLPESAMMDGANPVQILIHIYLPLCKASLATIAMYEVLGCWNSYMDGILYVNSRDLMLLQVYLRNLLVNSLSADSIGFSSGMGNAVSEQTMKMTIISISIVPIIVVYVFLQKFFKKGAAAGAVKG